LLPWHFLLSLLLENPIKDFLPIFSIGISNLKHRNYRNFQFAKGKCADYIFGIPALKDRWMSEFLGFT